MRNASGGNDNQPSSKQIINVILDLKSDNRLYKCLNKLKDNLIRKKIQYAEEVKKEISSHEMIIQSNEQLISEQKIIIDGLTQRVDYLNNQLNETKSSAEENFKIMDSHQNTIQSLSNKLKEAEKYIDDQNFAIDQLKKKLSGSKNDFENVKRVLKERFLERLQKAKQEIEEEREKMTKKLKQTREFYEAEGRDLKRQIAQLNDDVDLLRAANFSKPDQSTSRGKGRKRPTSTTNRDLTGSKASRRGGRATATKKTRTSHVDSTLAMSDDEELQFTGTKEKTEADSMFEEFQRERNSQNRPLSQ